MGGTRNGESMIELRDQVAQGRQTAAQAVERALRAIESSDAGRLDCFRETYADEAMSRAETIDHAISEGQDAGPLAGVPMALKDNIVTDFGRTCAGSRMLEQFASPYSSCAASRLNDAGAIIIGKTNCDEFAMGSSTEHCAFASVRNPWDVGRVPGGSSGGSAAAVAAGLCSAALGSDTGGSVRQPAAFCGVVGLKPSYGRVSRHGLIAFGSSLDQIGPITASVSDAALILNVIAGLDPNDSTSSPEPAPDFLAQINTPVKDLVVGVSKQHLGKGNDPEITQAVSNATSVLQSLGASILEIDLPLCEYSIDAYYVIAAAEASSNLARYDGIRYGRRAELDQKEGLHDLYLRSRSEGFGHEVQRRIMLGTYVLSAGYYDAYYKKSQQVRRLVKQELDSAFERCDVLLGPTTPTPAFRIGEKTDPLAMYLSDIYTTQANIAGNCAISLPGGFAQRQGSTLPVGIQLQARAFDEARLLRVARMFERATDYQRTPPTAANEDR